MSVLGNSLLLGAEAAGPTAYQVSRSLRFNSSDSAYCSRVPSSNGTSYTTWTFSCWVKRANLGTQQGIIAAGTNTSDYFHFKFTSNDVLNVLTGENGATNQNNASTAAVFRDAGAWYHIVLQWDFTNATQSDRLKIYVNGTRQTLTGTIAAQNYAGTTFNRASIEHCLGRVRSGVEHFNGYLADIHFIDGQALTPSSFTEVDATTGQLIPKAYSGSFGTNGFWLKFSDNSAATATTLGKDYSPNGNNWTPNNLSVTAGAGNDSLVDTPTSYGTGNSGGDVRGNFCTLNPLDMGSSVSLSNGNLDVSVGGTHNLVAGTIMVSSGKYYAEFVATTLSGASALVGVCNPLASRTSYLGGTAGGVGYGFAGDKWVDGSVTGGQTSSTTGDVIGIALDKDNNQVSFYKNNSLLFTQTGLNSAQPYTFAMGHQNSAGYFNFGARAFSYAPPSGFKALVDTNLTAPVIAKPNEVMDVKLYTGNGSTQTVSGLQFNPDLVWIKNRNGANNNVLQDAVRGFGATKNLSSNQTQEEGADTDGVVTGTTSSGFTVSVNGGSGNGTNRTNYTYVGWVWDAGTTTSSNTQGSITSSVRANASAGFSIVTYTTPSSGGPWTVGHGLNVAPSLIICKNRSSTGSWVVYHATTGNTGYLLLNATDAFVTQSQTWNSTSPSSTVFTQGTTAWWGSSTNFVSYCFSPVAGYSSFGSYTGNGSTDGPFVFCGFRPRWILLKNISDGYDGGGSIINSHSWVIYDAARSSYNAAGDILAPNKSFAEENNLTAIDILSNGFKLRTNRSAMNPGSTQTMIYAAFAESPFQYARAR